MIITCPRCQSRYRINPAPGSKPLARVKCPDCQHTFEIAIDASPAPAAVAETAPPLVLVVDDARFFREMIRDLLSELPIRVETAADGETAWHQLPLLKPALLLLDLNIPGMTGQELIAAVRREPSCRGLRILAMSAVLRGEEAAREVRHLGADDFISKSFTPTDLKNRVRELLGL
jgi:predicted Zn finger-like uncharacterized protein